MKMDYKETKVFALILDDYVYVGRTKAKKVSAICYSHARGERDTTWYHFGDRYQDPELYILDHVTAHSSVTYRHVVAWVHVFQEAGYHVLNLGNVLDDAADLHPETAAIVDEILTIPLAEHLARGYCAKYKDADSPPALPTPQVHTPPAYERATAKLTIRLSEAEKRKFDEVAQALHLTHRETLQYLLQFTPVEDRFLDLMLQNHEKQRDQQKKRIADLENIVSAQREKLSQLTESRKKYVAMVQQGLSKFIRLFDPASTYPLKLNVEQYHRYMRTCETNFTYPESEDVALIRPVAILQSQGRTPALFILGVTVSGQCIKLRYYDKPQYVGLFPGNDIFGLRGSVWLMGWQKAEENVMQLMFALPVQIQAKFRNPMDRHERIEKWAQQFVDEAK